MKCPQCGTEAPDDAWNCPSCHISLYWAFRHYDELAHIRERQDLDPRADTPPSLLVIHEREMCARGAWWRRG